MAESREYTASQSRSTGHSVASYEAEPQVVASANVLRAGYGEQESLSDSELYTRERLSEIIGEGSVSGSAESGGVALVDPVELMRGLLSCDVRVADAVGMVREYYASVRQVSQQNVAAGSAVSSAVSSYSERRRAREEAWHERVGALPAVQGQCYLYPVRWARRDAYLNRLGKAPAFSDFVAMLEPGDLCMKVAQSYCVYRLDTKKPGPNGSVVYHIDGPDYDGGLCVGTVYECVAAMLRLYPFINSRYKCEIPGIDSIPLVGVVGWRPDKPSKERVSDLDFGVGLSGGYEPGELMENAVNMRRQVLVDVADAMDRDLGDTAVYAVSDVAGCVADVPNIVPGGVGPVRDVVVESPSVVEIPVGVRVYVAGLELDSSRVASLLLCDSGVRFKLASSVPGCAPPLDPVVLQLPYSGAVSPWPATVLYSSCPVTVLHVPMPPAAGAVRVVADFVMCRHAAPVPSRYNLSVPWSPAMLHSDGLFAVAGTVRTLTSSAFVRCVRTVVDDQVYTVVGAGRAPVPSPDGLAYADLEYSCYRCLERQAGGRCCVM